MKIKTRLLLEINSMIALSFVLSGIAMFFMIYHHHAQQFEHIQKETSAKLTRMCRAYEKSGRSLNVQKYFDDVMSEPGIIWAGYQAPSKRMIFHTQQVFRDRIIDDNDSRKAGLVENISTAQYQKYGKNSFEIMQPVSIRNLKKGVVRIVFSEDYFKQNMYSSMMRALKIFAVIGIIVFLIGNILGYTHSFALVKQLEGLAKGARALVSGKRGYTVPVLSDDEVGQLTWSFNEMSKKLMEIDRLKDGFITQVSHELQSPLAVIKGFLEKIEQNPQDVSARTKYIDQMHYGVNRLEYLINQTLDLTRLKAGKEVYQFEQADIGQVIGETVEFFQDRAGDNNVKLEQEIKGKIKDVYVDKEAMADVFANLISNAIKYTSQGTITLWAKQNGNNVLVGVRDTGVGIPGEYHEKIFEKFERLKDVVPFIKKVSGSGLGLAIVKEIIEIHKGKIWVESEPRKGANFIFTLPCAAPPGQPTSKKQA